MNVKQIFTFLLLVNTFMMPAHSKERINSANRLKKIYQQIVLKHVKIERCVSAHTDPHTLTIMKIRHPNSTKMTRLQKIQSTVTE